MSDLQIQNDLDGNPKQFRFTGKKGKAKTLPIDDENKWVKKWRKFIEGEEDGATNKSSNDT